MVVGLASASQFVRDEQDESGTAPAFEPDSAPIESAMMQRAEREPVGHSVRSAGGVPLNVRGVEPEEIVVEPDIGRLGCY